jgi:hypothetical protein
MAKKPPNQGKQWTSKDVGELNYPREAEHANAPD